MCVCVCECAHKLNSNDLSRLHKYTHYRCVCDCVLWGHYSQLVNILHFTLVSKVTGDIIFIY